MSRWRMLTVLGLVLLAVGCARTTTTAVDFSPRPAVGLANAPALYGSAPANDQRPHDAVANGLESCGRYLENGVLRYQWPPCPVPRPLATVPQLLPLSSSSTLTPRSASTSSATPWREKFFIEWPCSHRLLTEGDGLAVVACTVPEP
jgi:hypothetical protein